MTIPTIVRPAGGEPPRGPERRGRPSTVPALLLGVLLASLGAGCGGGGWVESRPGVARRARAEPRAFLVEAAATWSDVDGLAGSYRLTARRRAGRRGYDLWIAVRRPDRVRIEALRPTGATEALLIAGPDGIGLWLAEEGRLYRSADPAAFRTALGLPLGAREAVGILLGFGVGPEPPDPGDPRSELAWDGERQRIRTATPGATRWLHPVTLHFDLMEFRGPGGGVDVELSGWESARVENAGAGPVDDPEIEGPVPGVIRIEIPGENLELLLERGPWNPDPEFDEGTFRVPSIPGAEVLPVERLEIEGGLLRREPDDGSP